MSSSFLFYGWWDWRFLFLIVFSGMVDYVAAILIHKTTKKAKLFLMLSLVVNLGVLGIFKYSGFVAEQLEHIFEMFSISLVLKDKLPEFTYILPVGISFYTFQSMSYTLDVYKGKLRPTKNILHFFSYLVMFPQLVAGPIVRAKDFLKQLAQDRKVSELEFWNGIKLITIGYFQKTVLADNLGVLVDNAFAGVGNVPGLYWWVVMICFAFQIYFDFSGYSQIARGLAKLMGYHFKINFDHPYLALSLKEFWGRWHVSLSTWFRDYVYIPLGGSKRGRLRSHINLWTTMTLSGLWHGAQLNFILWGLYHSAILSGERMMRKYFSRLGVTLHGFFSWGTTLVLVLIGWVFFRGSSFDQIRYVLDGMFSFNYNLNFVKDFPDPMIFLIVAILYEGGYYLSKEWKDIGRVLKNPYFEALAYALAVSAILFLRGPEKEFIYFQF
ncbi:MBOAT family O-acyltransferase [Ulvibacterium marinum]|uniref:MBOAT family O-acyltransferase n=1 Tax=Ulvibacterium marinum TaxID=2419782 RepID=UPI0024954F84|nr:MBOAT family O-acyltransferase [Ulvibacterium marinum]